jgi:hypothetical protein
VLEEVSAEDNKAVVRLWIEAYNKSDTQAEADARTPGYVAHVQGLSGPLDLEPWSRFIASFKEAFLDHIPLGEEVISWMFNLREPSAVG